MSEAQAEVRSDVVLVDNTTFNKFVDEKLAPTVSPEDQAAQELVKVEAEKSERLAKEEADKKAEEDPTHELDDTVPKEKKSRLNERFSELTQKRKAAEAEAERVKAESKSLIEERQRLQQELDSLKNKYEPPKADDPEPQPHQFTDPQEYGKALKEWTAENTRREDAKKAIEASARQAAEKVAQAWNERQEAAKTKLSDYESTIAASDVKVSDAVRDAIVESDVGPEILYHLAKNPDFAADLGKLSPARAVAAIGRLEATMSGEVTPKTSTKVAEMSKAPPPISPIKNASTPVTQLRGSDAVPSSMTYEDWKAARQAGKIH